MPDNAQYSLDIEKGMQLLAHIPYSTNLPTTIRLPHAATASYRIAIYKEIGYLMEFWDQVEINLIELIAGIKKSIVNFILKGKGIKNVLGGLGKGNTIGEDWKALRSEIDPPSQTVKTGKGTQL